MTEAEFLLDLQSKVLWIGTPADKQGDSAAGMQVRTVPIVQLKQGDTNGLVERFEYIVLNKGEVAGPQVHDTRRVEEDPETGEPLVPEVVIHEIGDPVLDAEGNQIVLTALEAESVRPVSNITLPVVDALIGVQFLLTGVATGKWTNYDLIRAVPEYNFIEFFASVEQAPASGETPATEKWVKYKARFDDLGAAVLTEIVE